MAPAPLGPHLQSSGQQQFPEAPGGCHGPSEAGPAGQAALALAGPPCSSRSLQVAAGTVLSSPPRLKAVPRWVHRPPSVVSFYLASLINVSYVNSILTTTLQGGEYYSQFTGGETEVQRW